MQKTLLRELVAARLNRRWEEWSREHPHLARAIDRTHLIESTVERLRDDARFVQAMRDASLDEAQLAAAGRVIERIESIITRVLRL